jgi:hypothetical protein
MKFAAVVLGAVYMTAQAADQYVVAAPSPGAKKAPTFVVLPGVEPASWPLDYAMADVGQPCGAEVAPGLFLVQGRKATATRCEVAK